WAIGEQAREKGSSMVLLNDGAKEVDQIPSGKLAASASSDLVLSGDFRPSNILSGSQIDTAPRIWVNGVSLKSTKRRSINDGYALDVLLSVKPILKIKDSDGNILDR